MQLIASVGSGGLVVTAVFLQIVAFAKREISQRWRLVQLTRQCAPGLFVAIIGWILVTSLAPLVMLVAMGRVIGDIRGAAIHGMASPDGHHLVGALVVFGILFGLSLADGPAETALKMVMKSRFNYQLQTRLMRAVNQPTGIAHLEDPAVLDQLALAQGTMMSFFPGDAPMTLADSTSTRLQGFVACVILGTFRWWMGAALALYWMGVSYELHKRARRGVRTYTGNANPMRRAGYFNNVATLPGVAKELRVFGLGNWIVERLKRNWATGMAPAADNRKKSNNEQIRVGTLGTIVFLACVLYLARATYVGQISVANLAVLLSMFKMTQGLGGMTFSTFQLHWMLSGFPHIDELESSLGTKAQAMAGNRSAAELPRDGIRFESLSFRYPGAQQSVFDELSLDIPAGKSLAIVGANGAGKTTLVKLLTRLHEPTSGQISVDGVDLRDIDPFQWRKRTAVVFQDFNHYPFSASENVGIGSVEYISDSEGIAAAAQQAGVREFAEGLPTGWGTVLSKEFVGGTDLSGGQWQRIALARALFAAKHGAKVLILDEPTAYLDVRGEAAFYEQFLDITRGLTTIVISHRFSTVRLADQICVIKDGRVSETGTHESLVAMDGLYASMFQLQASRFVENEEESEGDLVG